MEKQIKFYRKCKHDWLNKVLVPTYGESPTCSICGKKLTWYSGKNSPRLDHCSGKETKIKDAPILWVSKHACNKKNIRTFLDEEFGILCDQCNLKLPTNRELRARIVRYILSNTKDIQRFFCWKEVESL